MTDPLRAGLERLLAATSPSLAPGADVPDTDPAPPPSARRELPTLPDGAE